MRFLQTVLLLAKQVLERRYGVSSEELVVELESPPAVRWRGVFASPTSEVHKVVYVYARDITEAQDMIGAVKEIRDPNRIERFVPVEWPAKPDDPEEERTRERWSLWLVERDTEEWAPKLVNDYYQPEKRAG